MDGADRTFAVKATLGYLVLSTAWIFFSDRMLVHVIDPAELVQIGTFKGLFYVVVSSALIFLVMRHRPIPRDGLKRDRESSSKTPFVAATVAVFAMASIAFVSFQIETSSARREGMERIARSVTHDARELGRWLVQRRRIVTDAVADEGLRRAVSDVLMRPSATAREQLSAIVERTRQTVSAAKVRIYRPNGVDLIDDAATASQPAVVRRVAESGEIESSPVSGSDGIGLVFFVPLHDFVSWEVLAVVEIESRLEDFLPRLLVLDDHRFSSSRTRLLSDDGGSFALVPPAAGENDGDLGPIGIGRPSELKPDGSADTTVSRDDHGTRLLVSTSVVPGANLRLVSSVDEDEMLGRLHRLGWSTALAFFVALFACLGFAHLLWQRQRLEEAVQKLGQTRRAQAAEDRYRATFEQVGVGIVHVSLDGRWIRWNSAFQEISGYSREELNALPVLAIFHPEERDGVADSLRRLLAGELTKIISERRVIRRDGSIALARITASKIASDAEDEPYLVAIAEDITERRATEDALRASEERFDLAMRGASDGLWDWNLAEGTIYYSPRWKTMLGYEPDEIADRVESHEALLHPDDVEPARARTRDILEGRYDFSSFEFRMRAKSGEWRHILSRAFVVRDAEGRAVRMVGTHADITERKRTELALRRAAAVFHNTQEGVVITDAEGAIIEVNPAFTAITGYRADEVLGRSMSVLRSGRQDEEFYRNLWKALSEDGRWQGEIWNRRKNGEIYPQWLMISTVRGADGAVLHRLGTFVDIGPLKATEDRLTHFALHDPLTDLPNRLFLRDRLRLAVEVIAPDQIGAVLFLDLDRFKTVNDSLGHAVGDALLCDVAHRLSDVMPRGAVLGRLGGDEFICLLPEVADVAATAEVAGRCIAQFGAPFRIADGREVWISTSIGISLFPRNGTSADELLKQADAALYEAKSEGGGVYRFFDRAMTAKASRRLELEARLRRALELGEFELHYQPLVGAKDGRAIGVEALIRWRDGDGRLIPPDDFLPLAEETGLIDLIGDWVLRTACRQMRDWSQVGLGLEVLAVNLSPSEFRRTDLVARVTAALEESGLPANLLEIEITEGALLDCGSSALETLATLRRKGVRFAIDDFGTGYSSLSYLRDLPIEKLKIDRSFIRGIPDDPKSCAITSAIVSLARTLGLEVLAEGVETGEQVEALRELGCDTMQGYFFSRPVAAADLPRLLAGRGSTDREPRASAGSVGSLDEARRSRRISHRIDA
ncbi:MAG: EAL domain-containing protein [Phyllobacteriaceae bacterium]|nr:EAL domain-containing protein [Phyllobacteriaceae bacterium]